MPRYVKDPWAKKSRKGQRLLNNMINTTVKIGAAAYNESKKTQKKKSSSNTSHSSYYPVPNLSSSSAQPNQEGNTSLTGTGCLVIFLATIVGVIILVSTKASAGGIIGFAVVMGVSAAIATIASRNAGQEVEESTEKPEPTPQYVPSTQLVNNISSEILGEQNYSEIDLTSLTDAEKRITLRAAFAKAVNTIKDSGMLISEGEARTNSFAKYYSLNEHDLQGGAYRTMTKLLLVNDLLEGKLPNRLNINGALPINMQSGESLIWAETKAHYYEERVHRSTVGRSAGVSMRIASGLYYRTSAFKGTPVVTREMTNVAPGVMYITNKNIYFQSEQTAFRIPYTKIIAYIPYEDGIGIQKDGTPSNPIFIKGIDGWLAYNIVTNINNIGKIKPQVQTSEVSTTRVEEYDEVKITSSPLSVH